MVLTIKSATHSNGYIAHLALPLQFTAIWPNRLHLKQHVEWTV